MFKSVRKPLSFNELIEMFRESGARFTHFAFMTWTVGGDEDYAKKFQDAIKSGLIVEVEQKTLGMTYKVGA